MAKVTFAFGDYLSLLCKFSPLLRASLVAKTVKILPTIQETWVIQSLGQEGNGNALQYSCLENSMGRGAWQATAQWVAKSQT